MSVFRNYASCISSYRTVDELVVIRVSGYNCKVIIRRYP